MSFEHFTRWNRMAIVTDEAWLRTAYKVLSPLVHGTIKSYPLTNYEEARQWVSAPLSEGT